MWWLPVLGLVLGIGLGVFLPIEVPGVYNYYFAVALMAALDGVLGGLEEGLRGSFDLFSFWSKILATTIFALLLVFIGDHLGVELYLAILFALCYRILKSVNGIHSFLTGKLKRAQLEKREK